MSIKLVSYGVRKVEEEIFNNSNTFGYELKLVKELLTDDNVNLCEGADGVILRGNCKSDKNNLEKMKNMGIKYVLTRTVGFDHIDLNAVKDLGFELCARVPAYSPNAVAELAVSLAVGLRRKTFQMAANTSINNFIASDDFFANEIRLSTVGVVGTGRIGLVSIKSFLGMGAKVIGCDPYASPAVKELVDIVDIDTIARECDIILLHAQYLKESNHHLINKELISKMKKGVVIVNAARGQLIDTKALLDGIESGKIEGCGLDVIEGESSFFFKNLEGKEIPDTTAQKLAGYYPRVIITPHLGSFTDEAVRNMVEITYKNLDEYLKTGKCNNTII